MPRPRKKALKEKTVSESPETKLVENIVEPKPEAAVEPVATEQPVNPQSETDVDVTEQASKIGQEIGEIVDKKFRLPEPDPISNIPEIRKTEGKKIISSDGRRWWLVIAGACGIPAGIGLFMVYNITKNALLGVAAIGLIGGGIYAIIQGLKSVDRGYKVVTAGSGNGKSKAEQIIANSLNIYRDEVKFEKLEDDMLTGQPWKCRNDGKYYYTNILGTAFGGHIPELVRFQLPDTQYRDPREFANYINIPAHRKLAQRKANLLEKITPWALVVAILIIGIIMIATTSTPPAAAA